jgi:hypothetical protein
MKLVKQDGFRGAALGGKHVTQPLYIGSVLTTRGYRYSEGANRKMNEHA